LLGLGWIGALGLVVAWLGRLPSSNRFFNLEKEGT